MQQKPLPTLPTSKPSALPYFNPAVNGSHAPKSDQSYDPSRTAVNTQFQPKAGFAQAPTSHIQSNVNETRMPAGPQVTHHSRLDAYQSGGQSRPTMADRSFSPLQAYQNHIASMQQREGYGGSRGYPIGLCSPMPQRKFLGGVGNSGPSSLPVSILCCIIKASVMGLILCIKYSLFEFIVFLTL